MSTVFELGGFACLTAGAYEIAGRGVALVVLAAVLLLVGLAADRSQ